MEIEYLHQHTFWGEDEDQRRCFEAIHLLGNVRNYDNWPRGAAETKERPGQWDVDVAQYN